MSDQLKVIKIILHGQQQPVIELREGIPLVGLLHPLLDDQVDIVAAADVGGEREL
jgi:hypothetical protein